MNVIAISFTKKEIYSLVNEEYLTESNTFNSALNKIKLIANKSKISFTKIKDFVKKIYSAIKEVPKFRIVGGVLLCTISLNMINASTSMANGLPTFTDQTTALAEVAKSANNNNIVFSDGKTYVILDGGDKALRELVAAIKSDGSVKVPRVPQAVAGIVSTNITFSNSKELSHGLESIWDKYKSTIDSNSDLKLIHINSNLNNEQVNFIFVPNPESINHEEFLEILKEKGLNPPDDFKDNASFAIGEKAGNVSGFINRPNTFKEYGRWSFVAGKSKGSKATLLHEASHLFGIQKEIRAINRIFSRVESQFAVSPVYVEAIVNKEEKIKSNELTKWGDYELKNYNDGIRKDDLINLIAKSMYTKLSGSNLLNAAEWVASIGLNTGRIKEKRVKGERLYLIMNKASSLKLDYYMCPEETSRYYDSIRHYIEETKENASLSSFSKELLLFYKDLKVEKKVKDKIEKLKGSKKINVRKEIVKFRNNLLAEFKTKINKEFEKNKNLSQKDKEIINHFYVDIIFFITKYFSQNLQSINAEGGNIFDKTTGAEEKLNSLGVLHRFAKSLDESKKLSMQYKLLQEKIYDTLLKHY